MITYLQKMGTSKERGSSKTIKELIIRLKCVLMAETAAED